MLSLRSKKQYVNLCITQETEVENSLRLLQAKHGPEGIAAAPAKRKAKLKLQPLIPLLCCVSYIILCHFK